MRKRFVVVRSTGLLPVDEYWLKRAERVRNIPVGWTSIGDFVLELGYDEEPDFTDVLEVIWSYVNRQRGVNWVKCIDLGDGIYSFIVKKRILMGKLYFASPGGRDERTNEGTEKVRVSQRVSSPLRI